MEICGRAAVAKLSQISPKTPLYIGEGGGALPWGPRTPKGSAEPRGEGFPSQTESYLVWKVESFFPFPPPPFFPFLFDFLTNAHRPLLGCSTSPLRAGAAPQSPMGFPGVGGPPR